MSNAEGKRLHTEAAGLREQPDKTADSLASNVRALVAYADAGNPAMYAEVIADGVITKRNHGSRLLLIHAKHDMRASVEIARESKVPTALALPLFELAKVQESLGELSEAALTFREAVNNPLPEDHDRGAVRANFRVHLATAEYKAAESGEDKQAALQRAEEALHELERTDENRYEKDVWISGGYMRIATMLRTDEPERALQALHKAREIIDANPELEIRRNQWEKLATDFIAT